jgi:flagellin-like protein
MARKGISPVVAVVLLIAVAISVGILVTTWITHLVTTRTTAPSITCAVDTNYIIDEARFNESGDNQLYIKITNKGALALYGFGAVMDNGTRIITFNSSNRYMNQVNITSTNRLDREEAAYIIANLTNETLGYPDFGATIDELRVLNDACDSVSARTSDITKYPLS